MYKLILILGSLTFYVSSISAQYVKQDQMIEDINEFEEALFKLHPGLNYHTSISTLESIFKKIKTDLPDSLALGDFFNLIEPIIDTIKCGHTNLKYANKMYKEKEDKKKKTLFPAPLTLFEDRLFLSSRFKNDRIDLPKGTEILRIDDRPALEIIKQLSRYHSGADGDNQEPEKYWGVAGFRTNYARLYGLKERHKILVKRPDKKDLDLYTLYSISYDDLIKKNKENKPEPLELSFTDDNIAVLKLRTFSNKNLFKKSRKKIKKAFKKIKDRGANKLVIDLRNNGGGAISNVNHMLSYLLKENFKIVKEANLNANLDRKDLNLFKKIFLAAAKKETFEDKILLKKYNNKKKKVKNKLRFDGGLVVLINERSYSASTMFSAIIKDKNRGTLLGSNSGGSYYISFAGFSKYLKLKNSQIRIRIPLIRMVYNVTPSEQKQNIGIVPDMERKPVYDDLLDNENDSVKSFALEYLRNSRNILQR